ncbi:MAG: hypothetical protein Q8J65_00505, partial [Nitrosomonadales bacterium]|nr:hypothetical protein [Nitrosomonadales bacterium]
MSNQVKNTSVDSSLMLETSSLAHNELKKLESCIDLLVGVTNSLQTEMSNTGNKSHYIRYAKAIQGNVETIRRLTASIHDIKLKERKAGERDISPCDW